MSHWAVNDGKMAIWKRKDGHLRTAKTKSLNVTQKELEQRSILQSRQISNETSPTLTNDEMIARIRSFLAGNIKEI